MATAFKRVRLHPEQGVPTNVRCIKERPRVAGYRCRVGFRARLKQQCPNPAAATQETALA